MVAQDFNSISFDHEGTRVQFRIDEPNDVVQRAQASGSFYELPTLERLRNVIPEGSTIIDAGANVGNHSVYFGLFCKPRRVIPFEPNVRMASIMLSNFKLNALSSMDTTFSRFALGKTPSRARLVVRRNDNWGNGHLIGDHVDPGATVFSDVVEVRPIDEFKIEDVDFIKIDVEGHELEVIHGALETIKQSRPTLFIEVGNSRLKAVADLLNPLGYQVIDVFCQYRTQLNLLYIPVR